MSRSFVLALAAGLLLTANLIVLTPDSTSTVAGSDEGPAEIARPQMPAPAAPTSPLQQRLYDVADELDVDWRGHGVALDVGCHPAQVPCGYGSFDGLSYEVHVREDVFDDEQLLHYTVAHELAHVWQRNHVYGTRTMDLGNWDLWGTEGLEKAADCLAKAWGYGREVYWDCPDDAAAHLLERFISTTSHHRAARDAAGDGA